MSNFSASVPVANMQSANAVLEEAGYGPNNFSVPAYAGPSPTVALLHAWGDPAFETAVLALPGVIVQQTLDDPVGSTSEAADLSGAQWSADAQLLEGLVYPGLYRDLANVLWWVIQPYDTTVYPDPLLIPALIREAKVPGSVLPWQQPIDQYDAYKLVNPFTGLPDQCLHSGQQWKVSQADGAGNNIWEPGVFGWVTV